MKFSIIIPVYNAEKYLETCLQNLIEQTYSDFEVICVNDASTDESLNILKKYECMDRRIKLINHKTNCGTSKTRKDGVLASKGDYILFVDADDILLKNACQRLDEVTQTTKVDIVQFRVCVIGCEGMTEKSVAFMDKSLQPYLGEKNIRDVRKACFEKEEISHVLWGKLFDGNVCRKAFSYISDNRYVNLEDLYAFFAITGLSESYFGVEDVLYQYNYGIGITGKNKEAIKRYELQCSIAKILPEIKELAVKLDEESIGFAKIIHKRWIKRCGDGIANCIEKIKDYSEEEKREILWNNLDETSATGMIFSLVETLKVRKDVTKEKRWLFPYENIEKDSRVILYGAGRVGQDYYEQIKKTNYCEIVAWVDEDYKMRLGIGEEVISPDQIKDVIYDKIIVAVYDGQVQETIKNKLILMGVDEKKIVY